MSLANRQSNLSGHVLEVSELSKRYGDVSAVERLSFTVARGEIVGLLGVNGAGKTTTINMILGVLAPSTGQILIEGYDIAHQRSQALARTNFAAVYAPLPGNLTVSENLKIFGLIYGIPKLKQKIAELLQHFQLERFAHTRCGVLSSGEQTRVALAKAMLNQPDLLLLDEPTASLDPATAREIRAQIRDFAASKTGGVLWTSHNMNEVEAVCDRVLFVSKGRILLQGDPKTLSVEQGYSSLEDLFIAVAREPLQDSLESRKS